jgi:hypothetical protein
VDPYGRPFLNREALGQNYFVLRMDDYPLTVAAGGRGTSMFSNPEDAGHAGDFEVAGIVGIATAPYTLEIAEVGVEANSFMNAPIHHNVFAGLGGLPFILKETFLLGAGHTIMVNINNLSATIGCVIRLALIGRRFNSEMSREVRQRKAEFLAARPSRPYWLTLDNTRAIIGANSLNNEVLFTMPSGSHMLLDTLMFESTNPFEIALFDGQNGRALTFGQAGGAGQSTGFVDSRMIAGSANLPGQTIGSPIVQPRKSIRALINDLGNAGQNTIFFTFHGRRMSIPVG